MNLAEDISAQLKTLLEDYHFSAAVLSAYLELTEEEIMKLTADDTEFLPDDKDYRFDLFGKISFLYHAAVDDKDVKLKGFLHVLLSLHRLSKDTISAISGVSVAEIDDFLSMVPKEISLESKYKLAVTVMSLRFFLKGSEPQD